MIVAFTGHRPNKLGGYRIPNPIYRWVTFRLRDELEWLKPSHAISGMALGVDQWAAEICIRMKIPFTAALPFAGQQLAWPPSSQNHFFNLLQQADRTIYVSPPGYEPAKMQRRNEWMVDNCDVLIAVWDGTPGGTGNCVAYAASKGKEIIRIQP